MSNLVPLSNKHRLFVDELFLQGFHATKAYLSVYKGVTTESACERGSKLLRRDNVKAEILARQALMLPKQLITRDEILQDLIDIKNAQKTAWAPSALKALEIILKMQGFNSPDEIKISGDLNLSLKFPSLNSESDEESEEDDDIPEGDIIIDSNNPPL